MFREKINNSLLISCLTLSVITHALFFYSVHLSKIERSRSFNPLFENQSLKNEVASDKLEKKVEYTEELQEVLSQMVLLSRQGKNLRSSEKNTAISKSDSLQQQSSEEELSSEPNNLSEYDRKQLFEEGLQVKDTEDFAQSAFASLEEGQSKSSKQKAAGQVIKGDVISSQLNDFDTTYKRLQLGMRNNTLPDSSPNPSLKASSQQQNRNHEQGPFHLAVPSQKEQLSKELIYNQSSVTASSSFAKFLENTPTIEDFSLLPDISQSDRHGGQGNYEGNVASDNDFSIQLNYAQTPSDSILFELKLLPKKDVTFKRIKQNLYFLIDRSSSISKAKFQAFKTAVSSALKNLHPSDSFNILFFDNGIERLSQDMLQANKNNIDKAYSFIDSVEHGGLFASTDLYASLDKIIPSNPPENQVNLAILLTDGDTYLDLSGQRKTIYDWTLKNDRKVSLFTFASGSKNNLPLLELLSTFNKGKLFHANFHSQLPKRLQDFILSKRNPIGKDVIINAITKNDSTAISIFPRGDRLPDLYENTPYSIYGEISQKDDFVVFIQGRHYQQWLNIKQKINFQEAAERRLEVTNSWTLHKALDHYEKYLKDGILSDLRQANYLLSSLKTRTQIQ